MTVQAQANTGVFSEREMLVLSAVSDTLVPALPSENDMHGLYARRATDLNIPAAAAKIIEAVADPASVAQLKLVLNLLDQPFVNLLLGGFNRSFLDMTPDERTHTLRDWAESRLEPRRRAFFALKRLVLLLFYSLTDESGCNANWPGIGYPGPTPTNKKHDKPIKPLAVFGDTTLETDVVIVGSGAGGGVVAGELSAAGLDVIVLEKGGYHAEPDFDGRELDSQARMYEKQGFMVTADQSMIILAGSTLGGGTTINWAASLRPPDHVLHEWARQYGVTGVTGAEFQKALDSVSKRINVNENESEANPRNAVLIRGGEALGYEARVIPRNVKGCEDCGFCGFGCPYGAKRGTLRTYLQDAYERGTRIAANTYVERIVIDGGRAAGVIATTTTPDGKPARLIIRAQAVVAAAGALHTPALLLRSGLTNAHIGRNLHLHPSTGTFGIYEQPICGWSGVMLSHYIRQFANLDGRGYGVTIESAPGHPGLAAIALPWRSGSEHKALMAQYAHLANVLVIARDWDGGRVTLDRNGDPVIHYQLSDYDRAHLLRGVIESMRIHKAAGAREIISPVATLAPFREGDDFDEYVRKSTAIGLRPNAFILGSAHQMSSCRMGSNPARGAVDPTGEAFEVRDLFVADASALPTATGVNPMLTIMGVAYLIAQHIKARLTS